MKLTDFATRDELLPFNERSNWEGAKAVALNWGVWKPMACPTASAATSNASPTLNPLKTCVQKKLENEMVPELKKYAFSSPEALVMTMRFGPSKESRKLPDWQAS